MKIKSVHNEIFIYGFTLNVKSQEHTLYLKINIERGRILRLC